MITCSNLNATGMHHNTDAYTTLQCICRHICSLARSRDAGARQIHEIVITRERARVRLLSRAAAIAALGKGRAQSYGFRAPRTAASPRRAASGERRRGPLQRERDSADGLLVEVREVGVVERVLGDDALVGRIGEHLRDQVDACSQVWRCEESASRLAREEVPLRRCRRAGPGAASPVARDQSRSAGIGRSPGGRSQSLSATARTGDGQAMGSGGGGRTAGMAGVCGRGGGWRRASRIVFGLHFGKLDLKSGS